jgi:hypothetical protein
MKFWPVLILLFLFGCKTRKPIVEVHETPLELRSIKALNLSEDGTIVSTQNDEILVSILFGSYVSEDRWFVNGYSLPLLVFDSSRMAYSGIKDAPLGADFACPTCEVWICLTEMDDDGTEFDTNDKLIAFVNARGYKALESKALVDSVMKDNDFLGFARIPYYLPKIPTTYTIKGNDLLDKYEYQLTISTEKWEENGTKN